jgi:polysaccharide biosynthesis protein PslH
MGKAVLASPAAAEGIDAKAGHEILVAASAEEQAAAIKAMLANPAQLAVIGATARARMVARYSWDARMAHLPALLGMAK